MATSSTGSQDSGAPPAAGSPVVAKRPTPAPTAPIPPTTTRATNTGKKASKGKKASNKPLSNRTNNNKRKMASPTVPPPSTPTKQIISPNDLRPGQRSPQRMENNTYCYGCDHDNLGNIVDCEKNSFTERRMEQRNYPTQCNDCKKSFLKIKITDMLKVRCCKNAINHREHKCVWAVCAPCYDTRAEKLEDSNGRRSRKRQRTLL